MIGEKINDIRSYNDNMTKSMEDKLWFTKYLPPFCVLVDFGCADGTLINELVQKFSSNLYIGYDVSKQMIDFAKSKFNWNPKHHVTFTTDWEEVKNQLNKYKNSKKVLVLSSVIHEIFSYGNEQSIKEFFDILLNTGFDYIFIRDMMCSSDIDRSSTKWDVQMIKDRAWVGQVITKEQLESFELQFGNINNNKELIHFLLKYRWKINWEREVKENYFPIYIDDFLNEIKYAYNVNYLERFRVPFLDKCWKEDFNIEIEDYTHIKLFLRLRYDIAK